MSILSSTRSATRPGGRVFISYRRPRAADRERLVRAMRVHGVPTWYDTEHLGPHSTPEQIRAVIADPTTSGAILWITPDLPDSAFVTDVELPALVERAARRDGFFLQLVAAGGLSQEKAAEIASRRLGTANLAHWNVMRVDSDPLDAAGATLVARALLRNRLEITHAALPAGESVAVTIDTWMPAPFSPDTTLQLDWSPLIADPHVPDPTVWAEELEPALNWIADEIVSRCPGRGVHADGHLSLGVAMALGHCFRDTTGVPVTWTQTHRAVRTDWSLAIPAEDSGVTADPREEGPGNAVIALLVSAVQPVEAAFADSHASLPPLRGVVDARMPNPGRAAMTPGQGVDFAEHVRRALVSARSVWRPRGGGLHVFIAAPAGLALLIGQLLNTFGPITVHEYVKDRDQYVLGLTFAESRPAASTRGDA